MRFGAQGSAWRVEEGVGGACTGRKTQGGILGGFLHPKFKSSQFHANWLYVLSTKIREEVPMMVANFEQNFHNLWYDVVRGLLYM